MCLWECLSFSLPLYRNPKHFVVFSMHCSCYLACLRTAGICTGIWLRRSLSGRPVALASAILVFATFVISNVACSVNECYILCFWLGEIFGVSFRRVFFASCDLRYGNGLVFLWTGDDDDDDDDDDVDVVDDDGDDVGATCVMIYVQNVCFLLLYFQDFCK